MQFLWFGAGVLEHLRLLDGHLSESRDSEKVANIISNRALVKSIFFEAP